MRYGHRPLCCDLDLGLCNCKVASGLWSWLTWLSALAMLLQGHATAAWLWIVSRRLCLGQDESRRVQSGPCQHSRYWLHRAIFSLVALILADRVHTIPMPALDSDLVQFCSRGQSIEVVVVVYEVISAEMRRSQSRESFASASLYHWLWLQWLTTREAAWYITSVVSVCLYVCMYVCLSDDNFRKPWRIGSSY